MDAQTFAANQLENHAKSFLKALTETPEEHFFSDPPAGGHMARPSYRRLESGAGFTKP
jgi:hypothetical protein